MRRIRQSAEYANVAQRQQNLAYIGKLHAFEHQVNQFDIRPDVGETIHLRPRLQRFAHIEQTFRPRVQHRTCVAQTVNPLIGGQKMRIDTRHLRRNVGTDAQLPTAQLIDHQNSFQRQTRVNVRQQGMAVFHQRRLYQLVTVHSEQSQQLLSRAFQLSGVGRQHIGNMFGKLPRLHGNLPSICFCKRKGLLEFKTRRTHSPLLEIRRANDTAFPTNLILNSNSP